MVWVLPFSSFAQSPFMGFENLFTIPKSYIVNYTKIPPVIDGDIDDAAWQLANWTEDFEDIEGSLKPKPSLKTNVKMLWGDSCLYIAAKIQDPDVWATLTRHDEIVFHDNDFEVFLDPHNTTHRYFEMEFNALNTVFDLFLSKPYRNDGSALINWDVAGLRSAVKIQGTLNNPSDTDQGWTIEMAIPFWAVTTGNNIELPHDGSLWRINFSRVEWDTEAVNGKYVKLKDNKGRDLPEHNWVWSPQGVIDMHYPERWGYLEFRKESTNEAEFKMPYSELQKQYLWLIYYQEKKLFKRGHTYSSCLDKFGLNKNVIINNKVNTLEIEATKHQFMALITCKDDQFTWTINQEGLIKRLKKGQDE